MTTPNPCEQLRKERDAAEKKRVDTQNIVNSIDEAAGTLGEEYQDREARQKAITEQKNCRTGMERQTIPAG
jgi:predicted ribonuclease toxin of YeeF-YezG toxin-antitoxin module